ALAVATELEAALSAVVDPHVDAVAHGPLRSWRLASQLPLSPLQVGFGGRLHAAPSTGGSARRPLALRAALLAARISSSAGIGSESRRGDASASLMPCLRAV